MTAMRSATQLAHRDGVSLAYERAGSGGPPIILVHGWGTDRTALRHQLDALAHNHDVVAVDLRGFGDSDAPEQPYTIEGYAQDVFFIAQQLGLERPLVIGHSLGGAVAFEVASRYGAQLSGVVILEAMVVSPPPLLAAVQPLLTGLRSERSQQVLTGFMTQLTGPHFDDAERARLISTLLACPLHVLLSAMQELLAYDSVAAAARITCNMLYVGTATPYSDLAQLRSLCPQLVTGQLVGCGHYFPLEVPQQLNPMIQRFIDTQLPQ